MGTVAKALMAALVAGYAMYQAARGGGMTVDEWVDVAYTTAVAGFGVWLVPNTPASAGVKQTEGPTE